MTSVEFFWYALPQLLAGVKITLTIAVFSALIGFFGGTLLAIAQTGRSKILKTLVTLFTTIVRGTPMLLHIMFFFLVLPGSYFSPLMVAICAIGLNSSAYVSQIIRAGIMSVSAGQIEAARTLGISSFDITRYIILPQALQVVIPALGNELITLVKDSSLASLIGVLELYKRGEIIISQTLDSLSVYCAIGVTYLIITSILAIFLHIIENRLFSHARN